MTVVNRGASIRSVRAIRDGRLLGLLGLLDGGLGIDRGRGRGGLCAAGGDECQQNDCKRSEAIEGAHGGFTFNVENRADDVVGPEVIGDEIRRPRLSVLKRTGWKPVPLFMG